ncbi:MAG: hypothetical protein KAX78_05425 [Phycisphaerae bacterium]|nr:hypothetical protein [Phycisphaerae bacterium]
MAGNGTEELSEREFDDLVTRLGRLGEAIDSQSFPGRAWDGPPKRRHRIVWTVAVPAATAAVVLLAVGLIRLQDKPAPPTSPIAVAPPAALPISATFSLDVPTDISPAGLDSIRLEISSLSVPALGGVAPAATVDWDVPSISIPLLE